MADIVDPQTRSHMMARIKGSDTKPEIRVRRFLHACGFRFRLHRKDLPGKPDIVLPKYNLVIFVHGCFWHRHANCHYTSTPATRPDFWQQKFAQNIVRDDKNIEDLRQKGWRVFILWECGLHHTPEDLESLPEFITGEKHFMEWPAIPPRQQQRPSLKD